MENKDKKTTEDKAKSTAEAKKKAEEKKRADAEAKKKADAEAKKKAEAKKRADAEAKKKATAEKNAKAKAQKAPADKKKAEDARKDNGENKGGLRFLSGLLFAKMAKGGAARLRSKAEEVNQLNVFPVPDGDTGDNMRMTIESGVHTLENHESDDISDVADTLSHGMLLGARGNSGVILSQFFAGMARGLQSNQGANPKIFGKALEEGVKQAYTTVMTPTEGTILTVMRESVAYAVSKITSKSTMNSFFRDLVGEMHRSLEHTPDLLPSLKEAGVVDSGGAGLLYIMEGFDRVLNGEEVPEAPEAVPASQLSAPDLSNFGPDSEMIFPYCTEMLVQLMNQKCYIDAYDVDTLRGYLGSIGDSVVAVKTGSIVKLHVHTFTPEKIISKMREVGELLTVKIENMSLQHSSLDMGVAAEPAPEEEAPATEEVPASPETAAEEAPIPNKRYGIVAVATGEGIANLFREFGTDEIIVGGQTHNPSAGEFIAAYEKIHADTIFVFPNNGNILMAAELSRDTYDKARIVVIPSKSIGTGYVALSTLDLENEDPDAILAGAEAAIASVAAGYISPAIRNADMSGIHIENGDTIGIVGKDIVVSHADRTEAARLLIDHMLSGRYMLTVFLGKEANPEERLALEAHIKEKHASAEVYFLEGGQEVYPYIFVAE